MRRHRLLRSLLAAVACAASTAALPQAANSPAPPATSAATSALEPKMVDALDRTGRDRAGPTSGELIADTTVLALLDIGQTIESGRQARYLAWQPDEPRTRYAPRFHGRRVESLEVGPPG